MKTLQIILSIVTLAFIAECTTSSGVVPLGQNTYMISRTEKGFRGASTSVKAAALKEANLFGTRQGKVMVVIKTVQKDMKPPGLRSGRASSRSRREFSKVWNESRAFASA